MDTAHPTQEETTVSETDPQTSANRLVLPSLEIKNFRAFRHLTIEKLGRVNLITGKNNVGKTSLLEALWLYAKQGSYPALRQLLTLRRNLPAVPFTARAETTALRSARNSAITIQLVNNVKSLFSDEDAPESISDIIIGSDTHNLVFTLQWFVSEPQDENGQTTLKLIEYEQIDTHDARPYIVVETISGNLRRYLLDRVLTPIAPRTNSDEVACEAAWTSFVASNNLERIWNGVLLRGLDDTVASSLRLIVPELKEINLINDDPLSRRRKPYLHLAGRQKPVPLAEFGDGINRLFYFMCALAMSENGIMLVDEIENGIHYSVLPDVWRLIFQTARRLNVQVFATTHSWDCIEAFQQAASEDDDSGSGVLVRLRNKDGDIVSTVFDEDDLAVITRDGIEVR